MKGYGIGYFKSLYDNISDQPKFIITYKLNTICSG